MGALIKSLSQTHLPTILILASVIFLFLSIGGQLGDQVDTNNIRRKFSAFLGGIFFLFGIVLYIGGQKKENSQKPLMLNESKISTYRLRSDNVPAGRIIKKHSESKFEDAKISFQINEKQVNREYKSTRIQSKKIEVLSSVNGFPSIIKKTILSDITTESNIGISGKEETKQEHGIFSGFSILIEKNNGVWIQNLLGAKPTNAQKIKLQSKYIEDNEMYPVNEIKIGQSWTLKGAEIARFTGMNNLYYIDGEALMRLSNIVDYNGEKCAVISVDRMWVEAKFVHGDGFADSIEEGTFLLGGEGTIYKSLSKHIDVKTRFNGTMKIEGTVAYNNDKYPFILTGGYKMITKAVLIDR